MTIDIYSTTPQDTLSLQELQLYQMIMDYRAESGLPEIPLSADLTLVAGRHTLDTNENIWEAGVALPEGANFHSWSDAYYYGDHRDPSVMWDTPERLGTDYPGYGFEIWAGGYSDIAEALEGWKNSDGHNTVIVNEGIWANVDWNAIGIGVLSDGSTGGGGFGNFGGRVYSVWFGREADNAVPQILGTDADEAITGTAFSDWVLAGAGDDTAVFSGTFAQAEISFDGNEIYVRDAAQDGTLSDTDLLTGIETLQFADRSVAADTLFEAVETTGTQGSDVLEGSSSHDRIDGGGGNDTINGYGGADTLIGGAGDDVLTGGTLENDLRDVIFGGDGNDIIDGGYGNDQLRGDAGDDVIAGGFGADTVIGGTGDDSLTGSALGDLLFGSEGDDFINGGFGFDRVSGGTGADTFFHLGVSDHGADWIQDYASAEGDRLLFGRAATAGQFQINAAATPGAGEADVEEAFVIYRPTGQIVWALVDGMGQDAITVQAGAEVFDLMA